jgi:hypothetical protein
MRAVKSLYGEAKDAFAVEWRWAVGVQRGEGVEELMMNCKRKDGWR